MGRHIDGMLRAFNNREVKVFNNTDENWVCTDTYPYEVLKIRYGAGVSLTKAKYQQSKKFIEYSKNEKQVQKHTNIVNSIEANSPEELI